MRTLALIASIIHLASLHPARGVRVAAVQTPRGAQFLSRAAVLGRGAGVVFAGGGGVVLAKTVKEGCVRRFFDVG
jgi:hypothetical protein